MELPYGSVAFGHIEANDAADLDERQDSFAHPVGSGPETDTQMVSYGFLGYPSIS